MADYRIELGIGLKADDLADIKKKINSLEDNPIKLKVDAETKELTNTIREALNSLSKGTKNSLTIDTSNLEGSITDIRNAVVDLKKTLGSLDDSANFKSLLVSVNQIATALGKVTDESETLVKSLSALSKKDFGFNFNLKTGNANPIKAATDYGIEARRKTIPALQEQASYLQNLLGGYQKADRALEMYLVKMHKASGISIKNNLVDDMSNTSSIAKQMEAIEKYIDYLKKIATTKGIDLSSFDAQFSKSAEEIVDDTVKIQTGAKQTEEALEAMGKELRQVFGGSGIDADGLTTQLNSIVTDLSEIKTTLQGLSSSASLEGLTQSFDKLSNSIELLIANATSIKTSFGGVTDSAGDAGTAVSNAANQFKKIDNITIGDLDGQIDNLKNALKSLGVSDSHIDAITKDLEKMGVAAKNITANFKNGKLVKLDVKGIDSLERAVTVTETLGKEGWESSIKYSQSLDKIAIAAEKVSEKLKFNNNGNSKFDIEIADVENKFNKLSNKSDDLHSKIDILKRAFSDIKTASANGDLEKLIAANEKYEEVLQDVRNQLKLNAQEEKALADAQKLQDDRQLFQSNIDSWLTKNSAAAEKFGDKMLELKAKAENCDRVELNHLISEFKKLDKEAEKAGLKMMSFSDRIKTKLKEYSAYFSVAEVFMYVTQGLRDMFDQVVAIDSAMTELKKVTNETDASYDKFLANAASRAKELGITIDGIVSSAADFARLGYEFKDVQGLAEVANIYSVVGDDIDSVETATQSLISTMTAFKDEMNGLSDSDFALSVVDKFNEVSNNFAISSGGIGEALQRSASSMAAANNSLDETIALITAANTVVNLCHAA